MTLHSISPRLFYEDKLPSLTLKTLITEPYKEGKKHLLGCSPIQCQLSLKKHIAHRLVAGVLYIPVINSIAYLILGVVADHRKPIPPVFYKNQEGLIYWHNEDSSWKILNSFNPSYKDILNSMTPLDPSEYEKEYADFKWRMQIQEAINLKSKKAFKKLLEVGKQRGILDKSFSNAPIYFGSLIHEISKLESGKKWIPLAYEAGVDFAKKDSWNNTGLLWSIANASNGTAMKILKTAGAGKYIDEQGCSNTPLHLAVAKGYKKVSAENQKLKYSNLEIVQELIAKKANLNIENDLGNTPLHLACIRRDSEMIRALLEAGADPTIKNKLGKAPGSSILGNYESACKILDVTAKVFTLDEKEFELNQQKALDTFFSLTVGKGFELEKLT